MEGLTGKFTLMIELGNDGMKSREDVADAILVASYQLTGSRERGGLILDVNGNSVGHWRLIVRKEKET